MGKPLSPVRLFALLSNLIFIFVHIPLAAASKETILYNPTWQKMVNANRGSLQNLLKNTTVIHKLQADLCPLGSEDGEEYTEGKPLSLTTLTGVVSDIVTTLNGMIPLVQNALDAISQGVDMSDLGIAASGPQDLIVVSNLRDQLEQYLEITMLFQESMLRPMIWFHEMPAAYRPFLVPSKNLSPFLCLVWLCNSYDVHEQPIPFPGSSMADVIAADNIGAVTIEIDTQGKEIFKRTLEGFIELLNIQTGVDQQLLTWLDDNIDDQKYNFGSLLPEWWYGRYGTGISSVIVRINNWAFCWKQLAPLDNLITLADSIVPAEAFLPVNPETKLVSRPAEGWPWEI
ncbi:hypothetical protein TWF481_004374 [Arthrobotrys musiformis]|uniref:Uncharacterized protein n=1 Tax=Arthrobotrys musiformis TaxID=47236 RepID=A0AAV9WLG8_9PEZI